MSSSEQTLLNQTLPNQMLPNHAAVIILVPMDFLNLSVPSHLPCHITFHITNEISVSQFYEGLLVQFYLGSREG